jgi:hypothetical protein
MHLNKRPLLSVILMAGLAAALPLPAAEHGSITYQTNAELGDHLKSLAKRHPQIVRASSVTLSAGTNNVWLVELGSGAVEERSRQPAMLVVAGIEGNDLAGTAAAVHWMDDLIARYATDEAIRALLDSTTLYVFPRMNPDAAASFFARPQVERTVNDRPVDEDRDGLMDEDGPEDLNGDGLITSMRVEHPEGEYILDPADARLLIRADRSKGERGEWRLLTEGIDADGDDQWNEDGPGGVNLNRNFPYNYRFFAPHSGIHQVSESETRALADFVIAHRNIGIVFTFGGTDNVVQTPKADSQGAARRPPTDLHPDDGPFYRELGKAYRDAIGLKKELTGNSEPGSFADWMYYHRGRLSLAARPWSPALQVELAKDQKPKKPKEEQEKPAEEDTESGTENANDPPEKPKSESKQPAPSKPSDSRNEQERAFLEWSEQHARGAFVPWEEIEHPDFPAHRVEVGGFAPFARTTPPESLLPGLARKQAEFLTELSGKLPRIAFRKIEVKHLGESVYDITVQIENGGYLPTSLVFGDITREVHPTRVILPLERSAFLSGQRVTMLGRIEGSGGMREVRYVIFAGDKEALQLEVISMLGGSLQTSIQLNQDQP